MNINTIKDALSAAIAADAALTAWCQTNYANDPTVFVGMDARNPPSVEKMPAVIVYPVSKSVGLARPQKDHEMVVDCWLHDSGMRERIGFSNIIEYAGIHNVEEMRKLVETVAAGLSDGETYLADAAIEYDVIEQFPIFSAAMLLTYQEESVPMGADFME